MTARQGGQPRLCACADSALWHWLIGLLVKVQHVWQGLIGTTASLRLFHTVLYTFELWSLVVLAAEQGSRRQTFALLTAHVRELSSRTIASKACLVPAQTTMLGIRC